MTDGFFVSDVVYHVMNVYAGEVHGEPPNNRLSKYEGQLHWGGQVYSLDNEKVLLRGCVLRNTKWCYGLVIFAGKETKLMMNSGKAMFKRTHIDRLMNILIIGVNNNVLNLVYFMRVKDSAYHRVLVFSFLGFTKMFDVTHLVYKVSVANCVARSSFSCVWSASSVLSAVECGSPLWATASRTSCHGNHTSLRTRHRAPQLSLS